MRDRISENREATILATTVLVVVGVVVAIAWGPTQQLDVIGMPSLGAVGMPIASIGLVIASALLDRRRARTLIGVAAIAGAIVIGLDAATHRSAGLTGVMPEIAIGGVVLAASVVTVEAFALARRATDRFWLRYLVATVAGGAVWALIELPAASLICMALFVACAPVSVVVWIARSTLDESEAAVVIGTPTLVGAVPPRAVAASRRVPGPAVIAAPSLLPALRPAAAGGPSRSAMPAMAVSPAAASPPGVSRRAATPVAAFDPATLATPRSVSLPIGGVEAASLARRAALNADEAAKPTPVVIHDIALPPTVTPAIEARSIERRARVMAAADADLPTGPVVARDPAFSSAVRRQFSEEEVAFFDEGDIYSVTGARADVTARTSIAEL